MISEATVRQQAAASRVPVGLCLLAVLPFLLACRAPDAPRETDVRDPDSAVAPADSGAPSTAAVDEPAADLVDPSLAPAIAGEDGWMYSRSAEADLDGDGAIERVVLTARAEMMRGRPVWDDGQPWQVYVEEPEGDRTYLYARFVQLGTVTMRIGVEEPGSSATVVLLEHVPDRLAIYEIEYGGVDSARAVTRFERMVDPTGELASPDLP